MESIEAFILAGGASRRMGTDKSQLLLDGQTLAQRIADILLKVATTVTIVGRETANSRLRFVKDVYPEWGALGGVHAALSACNSDWALVVACDMPFISEALVLRLSSFRRDFEAVAPVQPDGRPQPLCSLYRISPCLATAETLIQSGERKPVTLLQSVRTRWVDFAELNDLPDAASFFDNMNTPQDYSRAQSKGESLDKKD